MQIVIDIPEWKYKSICGGIEASKRCGVVGIDHDIHEAIANGTPLPKGHGRLIDADALNEAYTYECISECDRCEHCSKDGNGCELLLNAPTILEAKE